MFETVPTSLAGLDEETRLKLADLLTRRNEYFVQLTKLNELRIQALMNPSTYLEEQMNDFNSAVVAPLRDGMSKDMSSILDGAVNVDNIKALMPMILMGVLQSVNVPLLLVTLGLEPDMIEKLVSEINKFIRSES